MPTQRHPRYPAEQWQVWIDEQSRSGLSQRVFCEQKGLSKSSFQLWKRRLASGTSLPPQSSATETPLFAPVSVSTTEASGGEVRGWEIELDLGDGVCLYFQAGGYCIWSKRLERGRFAALSPTAGQAIALSHAEFEALVEGLDLVVTKRRQRWHPKLSAA